MSERMTSLERTLATMSGREPDRVPLFLTFTIWGARLLDMAVGDYLRDPASQAEGQLRLREEFGHDCLIGAAYSAGDVAAWGTDVIFSDDGPPNAGEPPVANAEAIATLEVPAVAGNPALAGTLETIRLLKERSSDVPIVGGIVAPFSLPVMQLGFDTYLDLLHERGRLFDRLMALNEEFCVAWANAQLAAGATAIGFADPMASTTMVAPQTYREAGREVARRTIARIDGPVAMNFASGRCAAILDDVTLTGAVAAQVSAEEDLAALKRIAGDRLTLIGNLNAIAMRRWSPEEAEEQVRRVIRAGAPGGRFILSDNHGEIPYQVPGETLHVVADAARRWGAYPIGPGGD